MALADLFNPTTDMRQLALALGSGVLSNRQDIGAGLSQGMQQAQAIQRYQQEQAFKKQQHQDLVAHRNQQLGLQNKQFGLQQQEHNLLVQQHQRKQKLAEVLAVSKQKVNNAFQAFQEGKINKEQLNTAVMQHAATAGKIEEAIKLYNPQNQASFGQPVAAIGPDGKPTYIQSDKAGNTKPLTGYQPIPKGTNGSNGPKAPTGYLWKDPVDTNQGVVPIKGGPKDILSGENAGKAQMLRTAKSALDEVKALTFEKAKDGKTNVNWTNVMNAQDAGFPSVGLGFRGIPKTQGRHLRSRMELGIQAATRIETGAAMPPSELKNTMTRYFPMLGDSEETVRAKLQSYEDFINGALNLMDPTGRFNEERFNQGTSMSQKVQEKENLAPKNISLEKIENDAAQIRQRAIAKGIPAAVIDRKIEERKKKLLGQ